MQDLSFHLSAMKFSLAMCLPYVLAGKLHDWIVTVCDSASVPYGDLRHSSQNIRRRYHLREISLTFWKVDVSVDGAAST